MNAVIRHTMTALFPEQAVPDPLPARTDEFILQALSDLSDDDLADMVADALDGIDRVQMGRYLVCDDFIALGAMMQKKLVKQQRAKP